MVKVFLKFLIYLEKPIMVSITWRRLDGMKKKTIIRKAYGRQKEREKERGRLVYRAGIWNVWFLRCSGQTKISLLPLY